MGKQGRKRKHDEKMKRRRAAKAARRSNYASLAGTGKRRKKQAGGSKISGVYKHAHIMANCGNIGCDRCFPKGRL